MDQTLAIVQALPDPAILIGADGRIAALNDAAQRLLGSDVTGWPHVTALRQPVLLTAIEDCQNEGRAQVSTFHSREGARDTTWDVSVRAAGPAVLLSFRDTTALNEADEKRRDFVANVSHELRTPLTSLIGFIETLRGPAKDDSDARDRFLGIMEQEAGRMHRLVEDLLSLSQVEDTQRVRPTTTLVLNDLVKSVLEGLAPVADGGNVRLLPDLPEQKIEVQGDWDQLSQVLRNLVENAIKYGGQGKDVTVCLRSGEGQEGIRLSVLDQGEGIADHHIGRLTERFYRVDSHRSREHGGTGLGLAISKHIIARHRGRLQITSSLEQGSDFTVILPNITH